MTPTLAGVRHRASRLLHPESVLLVPVHSVEPVLATWNPAAQPLVDGVGAHVTTLYPFLRPSRMGPAEHGRVAAVAASSEPFEFTLASIRRFPQGVLYLAPEPAAPFVALTERVLAAFPSCRPYGGAYDAVVPHVTVAVGGPVGEADEERLRRLLPLRCRAAELHLLVQGPRGWAVRARYQLGSGEVTRTTRSYRDQPARSLTSEESRLRGDSTRRSAARRA